MSNIPSVPTGIKNNKTDYDLIIKTMDLIREQSYNKGWQRGYEAGKKETKGN